LLISLIAVIIYLQFARLKEKLFKEKKMSENTRDCKITRDEFSYELSLALKDYFVGECRADKSTVYITLPNGQQFILKVE